MDFLYTQFNNSLDNYFDTISKHKDEIMNEYKNDKEQKNTAILTQKLNLLDNLLKNIIKYKNIQFKEKEKKEKEKFNRILGKK
jgi:hypothetical protein